MLDRRGFLGSALGVFASGSYFHAREANNPIFINRLEQYKRVIRAMESDNHHLSGFKLILQANGYLIKGSGLRKVEKENCKIKFIFQDFDVLKPYNIEAIIIVDDEGYKITKKSYNMPMLKGDIFKLDYTIGLESFGEE